MKVVSEIKSPSYPFWGITFCNCFWDRPTVPVSTSRLQDNDAGRTRRSDWPAIPVQATAPPVSALTWYFTWLSSDLASHYLSNTTYNWGTLCPGSSSSQSALQYLAPHRHKDKEPWLWPISSTLPGWAAALRSTFWKVSSFITILLLNYVALCQWTHSLYVSYGAAITFRCDLFKC